MLDTFEGGGELAGIGERAYGRGQNVEKFRKLRTVSYLVPPYNIGDLHHIALHLRELEKAYMDTLRSERTMYEVDLFEWENKPDEERTVSIDITDSYTYEILEKMNFKVSEILKAIHFPGYSSVRFDKDTFDFPIQDMPKDTTNGDGYCGVLNAVELLALREVLHEYGRHEIGILLLDSALTQLSESLYTKKGSIIRDGLLRYMIAHQDIGQVIIIEQREKMPDWVLQSRECNVIEFTKSPGTGIYGFLNDVVEEI